VGIVFKTFHYDDGISYQELDSIESEELYGEDDVVEVFIRANSGGTKLGKSDLLFSLLAASWQHSEDEMEMLLSDINKKGFKFTRDFILKTCLCLLNRGARYEVMKFRDEDTRNRIEDEWDEICKSIRDVSDFVYEKTFIRCDNALPSYLTLIPLIYLRHHHKSVFSSATGIEEYLIRTLLTGAFSGTPDQLINDLIKRIKETKSFVLKEMFGVIRSQGKSLELTEDRLWDMGYGSNNIHLLFNYWYRQFNYTPTYSNNMPQVDHIFPQSLLRKEKRKNPETGKMNMLKYYAPERNQLANCMLLTAQENGGGGKTDIPPEIWFKDKDKAYLEKHSIPENRDLWKLDRYDDFVAKRKEMILDRFKSILTSSIS